MGLLDYVHICSTSLVSNNKNIFKVKETRDKKIYNLLLKNMSKNSNTCYNPDKVLFNFSSYSLNDHEKSVLCKGLIFCYSNKSYLFKVQNLLPFEMIILIFPI